jgi:hypothetical protein
MDEELENAVAEFENLYQELEGALEDAGDTSAK